MTVRHPIALAVNLVLGATTTVLVTGALIGSGWQPPADAALTTIHRTSTTLRHTSTTRVSTTTHPSTTPPTVPPTAPPYTGPTYPRITRPTVSTTSTSTTSTTIAPINGRLPVVPSTLPLTTHSSSAHVSPVFAALSGAGFFVALVIMAIQWIRTRPRKPSAGESPR